MKEKDYFIPKVNSQIFLKCSPNWQLPAHFVNDNDMTYIIEGKARYTINGKAYELEPGDLVYMTEGMETKAVTYPKEPSHCFSVNFGSMNFPSNVKPYPFPVISHIGLRKDLVDLFWELTLCWSEKRDGYIMKACSLLMLILHRLLEILVYDINSNTVDYRINKAINMIKLYYGDKITAKGLAEYVQLNDIYFGRLFRKETGMSVKQYIIQVRVQNAELMLQTGKYKVQEVAELCGFSNITHFYNLFRASRGFPPSKCIQRPGRGTPKLPIAGPSP